MTSNLNSPKLLAGKAILVTGASGAIGRAIVVCCIEQGALVFAHGRNVEQLYPLVEENTDSCIPLCYEITDEGQVKNAFRTIGQVLRERNFPHLYGLVNNAGIMHMGALATTSLQSLRDHLEVNLVAAFYHIQLASRLMSRERNGSIVNIVSQAGEAGSSGLSAYAASKAGLSGLTKSVAKELSALNLRVNAVAPGFIDTPLITEFDEGAKEEVLHRIRLARMGRPEDVAHAVMYFLSEHSSYVTGQVLPVDGLFTP